MHFTHGSAKNAAEIRKAAYENPKKNAAFQYMSACLSEIVVRKSRVVKLLSKTKRSDAVKHLLGKTKSIIGSMSSEQWLLVIIPTGFGIAALVVYTLIYILEKLL